MRIGIRIEIFKNTLFGARPIFRIRFRLLDRRDTISWVEMDYRQKEWSKEDSKEQYLSYVALEVVLLPYIYVCSNRPLDHT